MESTQSSQRGQNTGTVSVDADESEYEDLYFVLELPGLSSQFLANCDDYAVIGLDTPTPMLQLGRSTFRGRHEEQLGTSLIFSSDAALKALPSTVELPASTGEPSAVDAAKCADFGLICSTERRIRFDAVFLERK